jgi:hypothetical protein
MNTFAALGTQTSKESALELVRRISVFDDQGNFCPFFVDSRKTVATDQVVLAIGPASGTSFCKDLVFSLFWNRPVPRF